jgi:arylsulfatase A-like enzyme
MLLAARVSRGVALLRPAQHIVQRFGRPYAAAAAVALALLPLGVARAFGPDTTGKPSVLVVLLDTVRRDHVGWTGGRAGLTPRLDALASRGVAFTQAVSTSSWTKPAVGSLVTGLVPSHHEAIGRPTLDWFAGLEADQRTLAEAFARAGYFTAAVSSNPNIAERTGFRQGFHRFRQDTSFRAARVLEEGERFLAERGDRPFFLYLHFNDAHYPYRAPDACWGTEGDPAGRVRLDGEAKNRFRLGQEDWSADEVAGMRAAYAEEIRCLDDAVGARLESWLAEHEDLVVVVLSDHGEEFLEHGDIGHGHTLYDELLMVPLQFAWGAGIDLEPREVRSQVSLLDVAPTLLEFAGLEWPEGARPLDGTSLLPLFAAEGPDRPAFAETESPGSPRSGGSGPLRAWRRPESKLIVTDPWAEGPQRWWLFDLGQDPAERRNLADVNDLQREALASEMAATGWWIEKAGPPAVSADTPPEILAELAELGYVDVEAEEAPGREVELAPGAVPWWSPDPGT